MQRQRNGISLNFLKLNIFITQKQSDPKQQEQRKN